MQITIALCDDDSAQITNLRSLISEWSLEKPFGVNISEYESAEQFLFFCNDRPCDLLLLDIEMRNINGIELAKKLRADGNMLPIVFITGYSEHISEGYDVEALHYLLKPVDSKKLFSVLDKFISGRHSGHREILISSGGVSCHIDPDRIACIEAFGRKTRITLSDGTEIPCDTAIGRFAVPDGFTHCHRSYIVNLRYVKSIGKTFVVLDSGSEIPLSRRLYSEVNQKFIKFYTGG